MPDAKGQRVEFGSLWPLWGLDDESELDNPQHSMEVAGVALASEVTSFSFQTHKSGADKELSLENVDGQRGCWRRLIVTPGSWSNFTWESVGGMHIAYDVLMIPMSSFDLPQAVIFRVAEWSTTLYWSADLVYQFFVSYEDFGIVERDPWRVALHYLKTWFLADLVVVAMDWTILVTGFYAGASRSWRTGKLMKAFKILRAVRLIRAIKFIKMVGNAMDKASSLTIVIYMKVASLVLGVLVASHYIGCYWYYVTTFDPSTSWVLDGKLEGAPVEVLYVHALSWAMTQSGFGAVHVFPTNDAERVYASGVSVTWLLVVMLCLSSFTLWAFQLRDVSLQQEKQEAGIRTYMVEKQISASVRHGVLRFFRLNHKKLMKKQHAVDIPVFSNLPVCLRVDLYRQMHMPVLSSHPCLARLSRHIMDPICHSAVMERHYPAGRKIFGKDEEARATYFVCSGETSYYADHCPTTLAEGDWISEAALWVRWRHRGLFIAKTSCEIFELDVQRFLTVMNEAARYDFELGGLRNYARLFIKHFAACEEPCDQWKDIDIICAMVASSLPAEGHASSWEACEPVRGRTFRSQLVHHIEGSLPWK